MTDLAPEQARLDALAKRYWAFECEEFPLSALLAGEELDHPVLFRESPEDYDRKNARAGDFLRDLRDIDADELDAQDQATHALLRRELQKIRDFYEIRAHLRPSLFPAGPDFNLIYFANSAHANTARAAQRYVERLAGVPAFVSDLKQSLQAGSAAGFRYPKLVLRRAATAVRASIKKQAEESPMYGPFERSTASSNRQVEADALRAKQIIEQDIMPSLVDYADYLENGLMRVGRDSIACTDDPEGDRYYELLVQNFTSLDLTPDEIHALGMSEVERLQQEIEAVAADAGFAGRAAAYRERLANDPSFVVADVKEHLARVQALCKQIDLQIPAFFGRVPRITYGVKLIPEALSEGLPPAYAQPSPADNSAPGVYWLTSLPEKCPTYLYPAYAVHEAWPGHLMQIALMQEQTQLPAFRRNGALKYTACIEGWAMYCEYLGEELGVYTTPHERYGRLAGEIWRAVRLVVDTGVHQKGWSREQALKYMRERVSLDDATTQSEIDRYIALPAQALAYQPGNLKFKELRQRAEKRLGDRFDIRAFHDTVIAAGPVTLPILDDLVEHWLNDQLAA